MTITASNIPCCPTVCNLKQELQLCDVTIKLCTKLTHLTSDSGYLLRSNTTNGNAVLSPGLYYTVHTNNNKTSKKIPYLSNINTNFQSPTLSGDSVDSIPTISEEAKFVGVTVGR